jgi:glycosyltransferase involved in cell wall biosynthesis
VVALADGGALETVIEGLTGTLVSGTSPGTWADAIRRTLDARLAPDPVRAHALRFGRERFAEEIRAAVDRVFASA